MRQKISATVSKLLLSLPEGDHDRLATEASKRGLSKSALVRQALELFFADRATSDFMATYKAELMAVSAKLESLKDEWKRHQQGLSSQTLSTNNALHYEEHQLH